MPQECNPPMHARKPYFLQLSDTHLFEDPAAQLWHVAPDPSLDRTVEMLCTIAPDPDFVLVTGDCSADGSEASYRRLAQKLECFEAPVYYLPGNHDDTPLMAKLYLGRTLPSHEKLTQIFEFAGWRFVLLDSAVRGEDAGSIGNAQRNWLRVTLAEKPRQPTIVAVHHNPLPVASVWLDAMTISDANALLAILDTAPQVRAVLFGHVHQEFEERREGTLYASVPSTFFQFKARSPVFGRDPDLGDGARIVALEGERIHTEVVRVGKPLRVRARSM